MLNFFIQVCVLVKSIAEALIAVGPVVNSDSRKNSVEIHDNTSTRQNARGCGGIQVNVKANNGNIDVQNNVYNYTGSNQQHPQHHDFREQIDYRRRRRRSHSYDDNE
jgi:hypothetical protein